MINNSSPDKNAEIPVGNNLPHPLTAIHPKEAIHRSAVSFGLPPPNQTSWMNTRAFIIMVSMFHGLYSVKNLAEFMYEKDLLMMSPTAIQLISGIVFVPWCIKPVFGFVYDKLLIRINKIGPIILVASLARIVGCLVFAFFVVDVWVATLIFLVFTFAGLAENICCESTLVKMTKADNRQNPEAKSNYLPIFFGYRSLGAFIGTLVGGRMVKIYSIKATFLASAFLSLLPIIFCLFYQEQKINSAPSNRSIKQEFDVIRNMLTGDKIIAMAAYVFILNLTPSFDQVSNYYLMEEHQFTEVDLSDLQAFSILCYVLGLAWYSYSLFKINAKKFYMATNVLYWVVNCTFLLLVFGITDAWKIDAKIFCYLNYGFASLIGELNFMPIIAIWCAICPPDLEATSITLFTGLMNLAYNCSTYLGAGITYAFGIRQKHFEDFWLLPVIQNWYLILVIIALFVIGFPDPTETKSTDSQEPVIKRNDQAIELVD